MIKWVLFFLFWFIWMSVDAQTPNGSRKAWIDTLNMSYNSQYSELFDLIGDSVHYARDTTHMKTLTGHAVMLEDSVLGGGQYVRIDSTYPEIGAVIYDHGTAGKQWIREQATEYVFGEWAGMVGDSTTDNEAAFDIIQRVAMNIGHGIVKFGVGDFDFEGNAIVRPGITLEGVGDSTMFTTDHATKNILAAHPAGAGSPGLADSADYNITIRKIRFKRDYTLSDDLPTGVNAALAFQAQSINTFGEVIVEDCIFENIKKESIQVWGARVAIARNNIFRNTAGWINLARNGTSIVTGNTFYNVYYGMEIDARKSGQPGTALDDSTSSIIIQNNSMREVWFYGVRVSGSEMIDISGNTVEGRYPADTSAANHSGVYVVPTLSRTWGQVNIKDNNIRNMRGAGIEYEATETTDSVATLINVSGNTIEGCALEGIKLWNSSDSGHIARGIVTGNILVGNLADYSTSSVNVAAMMFKRIDSLYVSGNTVVTYNNLVSGYPVYTADCQAPTFVNNDFRTRYAPHQAIAINMDSLSFITDWIAAGNLGIAGVRQNYVGGFPVTPQAISWNRYGTFLGTTSDTLKKIEIITGGADSLYFIVNGDTFGGIKIK